MKFVDLCAGIGGLSRPLHLRGHECVLACERDKFARITYHANYPDVPFAEDITTLDVTTIPPVDLVLAGFPCQPFSSVGKLLGFEDTRGTIVFDVLRAVKHLQPSYVLFENVRGLLTHAKGETFKVICAALDQCGYNVQHVVLDARVHVPQKRRRVFILGTRKDLTAPSLCGLPEANPIPPRMLAEILHQPSDEDRFHPRNYALTPKTVQWLYNHQNRKRDEGGLETVNFITENDLAATLTARYYKDGKEIVFLDKKYGERKLTPRECARLMGFDSSFILPPKVSSTQLFKQMGNSVVVPCSEAILKRIPCF